MLFRLKVGDGFVPMAHADALERRVTWERTALWEVARHVDTRWREVVRWEVDPAGAAAMTAGVDTLAFPAVKHAMLAWGERHALRVVERQFGDRSPTGWRWVRGEQEAASLSLDSQDGVPDQSRNFTVIMYRPNGTRLRDRDGGPNIFGTHRWYRADGSMVRVELRDIGGTGGPDTWCWYSPDGRGVRTEWDTNGDGIPDRFGAGAFHEGVGREPLPIGQSWAVHPELIPAGLALPDQPDRRVPVRDGRK